MLDYNIQDFRNGIFALNTRRFGAVAEIMIKKLYQFEKSNQISYDLYDAEQDIRIEVKFSRATRGYSERINEENIIEQCLLESNFDNKSLNSNDVAYYSFDSNIQQVKTRCFDYLFYGLFFLDRIEIYGIDSRNVYSLPGYSDHQHAGNSGEGQFHLNNNSIDFHRKNYFQRALTYHELFTMLQY